jgi:class 3 adenylate cyclase
MKCPKCQADNPETKKFCPECGTKLSKHCPHCGSEIFPADKFCGECGQKLAKTEEVRPSQYAKPISYTPKFLADKILTSRSALEGERKQVTVLFADLKASMELLADRDPEEARKVLDPVLERMMEAIHNYEGTVNQVMGDGIMALFGAPLAHEDHAVRACYAALRMQEAIYRFTEELRRSQGLEVQARVGMNSGEVVVRSVGSDLHMDYTAVGQTTHLAARMEQLAGPGKIRLTSGTLRLAEGFIEVKSLGPMPVKGLAEPIEVYELVGAKSVRSRLQPAVARGLSRFVGRDAEIEQLQRALQQAGAASGQVLAVVGEAGVGKSRLFHEFTQSQRMRGWLILEAASFSYGKATTFLPLIELLKSYFRIHNLDTQREIKEKITGKLLTLDRGLEPSIPEFLSLLDVPVDDPKWNALDPLQRRLRTLDAIKRLLLRESQVQSLLLIFEDLHWVDGETQSFLDALIESLPKARLFLLVNYRPEYQHSWANRTYYSQMRLDPLQPESAGELLGALLGNDPAFEPLKGTLIGRTGGNPLFLEESVRMLVETRVLLGERGAYRLAKAVDAIQIPATVQTILVARIDRLPPEEKSLLQCAAVIGKDVPYALLKEIAGLPEENLRRGLAHLQTAEFLYETRLFPDLEYTFKHALTYEVAYGSLLQERRRALHAAIFEAIERLNRDRLVEHFERLAHHALRAEIWDKALTYLRQASAKAIARSAHREAVTYLESALTVLTHLPESRERSLLAVDLRFELRTALIQLAELGRVMQIVLEAEALARDLNDPRRLGQALVYLCASFNYSGQIDQAVESGERAIVEGEALHDLGIQLHANRQLALSYVARTDYHRAVSYLGRSITLLEGQPHRELFGFAALPGVHTRFFRAWSWAELGKFLEAKTDVEDAVRIAEEIGHPASLAIAYFTGGMVHLAKGDFAEAMRPLEHGLKISRDANLPLLLPYVGRLAGWAYTRSGRVTEAVALLEQAVEQERLKNLMSYHALTIIALSEAYLIAGRTKEAIECAESALKLARERQEPGNQAYALHLLGEIASDSEKSDLDKVENCYLQAMDLAGKSGMRPLSARCHFGLGKLNRKRGNEEQAKDHLTTAMAMFREMDMRSYLEKAEAEIKKLR